MRKNSIWDRIARRLPIIRDYANKLDRKEWLLEQTDIYQARKAREFSELEQKAREAELELSELKKGKERDKTEIQTLNHHLTEKHQALRRVEAGIAKAQNGLAIFDTFKLLVQQEYWALHGKHNKLIADHEVVKALLDQDRQHLARALRSVDRLKGNVRFAFGAAKSYKFGANEYAMNMLTETLESAGISALIFDEETVTYSTSYVAETLNLDTDLVGMCFADVFEEDNLEAFSDLGPQHPLTTKKGKQFAGILFNFVTGHDKDTKERKHYRTIWLIGDRKIGWGEYFKGNEVAMPRNITAAYAQRVVGSHLNDRIGKSTKLAINCSNSYTLDIDAAEYLARVAASNAECKIEIRNPQKLVYETLIAAQFPEDKIKGHSPKKKEKDFKIDSKAFGLGFVPA